MGWEIGYDTNWQRDIGYGVPAECDHPVCNARIDRGLSYVCGGEPYGGENGCGLYFCEKHRSGKWSRCEACISGEPSFTPKADLDVWAHHKATHDSWAKWRAENTRNESP